MKKYRNQSGFSAVEGLLIFVIGAMLGGVGWYVWHSQKQVDKTYSQTANSTTAPSSNRKIAATDPILFQDSEGTLYSIAAQAKTADQRSIAEALNAACAKQAVDTAAGHELVAGTGVKDVFSDNANFKLIGNFAVMNTGCFDKTTKEAPWGNAANFYLKKQSNKWTFVGAAQGVMDCAKWDGTGVPAALVGQCEDEAANNTIRAPR